MFGIDWWAVVMVICGIFCILLVEGCFVGGAYAGVGITKMAIVERKEMGLSHTLEGIVCGVSMVVICVPATIWFTGLVVDCVTKWLGGL